MAHVEFKHCEKCVGTTNHINGKCTVCSDREYRQKIAAWKVLTTEEKLLDLMKRIEKLENKENNFY